MKFLLNMLSVIGVAILSYFEIKDIKQKKKYVKSEISEIDIAKFENLTGNVEVKLASKKMSIKELKGMQNGSVIEFDKNIGEPMEIYFNGKLVAKGEVVVIDDNAGIRITSLCQKEDNYGK